MHPLLFEIPLGSYGSLRVTAFGALLAVAFSIGFALAVRRSGRAGVPRAATESALFAACLAGVLGARLGYVLLHRDEVSSLGQAVALQSGGLSGAIGVAVGAGVLAFVGRARSVPLGTLFDASAPALAIATFFARLGCWLEGCDFGRPLAAHAPAWLARLGTFPAGSPAFVEQVARGLLPPSASVALPVHPSELYESLGAAVLLALAFALGRRQRAAGRTALIVLPAAFALRVLVDFTRAPSPDVWSARALFAAALLATLLLRWRPARALRA